MRDYPPIQICRVRRSRLSFFLLSRNADRVQANKRRQHYFITNSPPSKNRKVLSVFCHQGKPQNYSIYSVFLVGRVSRAPCLFSTFGYPSCQRDEKSKQEFVSGLGVCVCLCWLLLLIALAGHNGSCQGRCCQFRFVQRPKQNFTFSHF